MDLGGSWITMGAHWVPLEQIGVAGVTFGASRLHFGRAWELLDSIWGPLGVTFDASGIQNGCCRRPD